MSEVLLCKARFGSNDVLFFATVNSKLPVQGMFYPLLRSLHLFGLRSKAEELFETAEVKLLQWMLLCYSLDLCVPLRVRPMGWFSLWL